MTPRLYLHVGFTKTGTSYLQSVFWRSREELLAQGLDLVPGTPVEMHQLMLDVTGRYSPRHDPPAVGRAVERLPEQLRASSAPRALLTQEALVPADDDQIDRLLSGCASHEVHVLLTVRDLARQVPSAWQQRLRNGSPMPFDEYLRRLAEGPGRRPGTWAQKDLVGTLERWSRHVPAERIHVVTVPPPGGAPEELLRRFCSVLEVDPARLDSAVTRPNEALGHVGAELLRQVNERVDPGLKTRRDFGRVGKRYFALGVIGGGSGRKVLMPVAYADWCRGVSQSHVGHLRAGRYDVVGDPDDLMPADASFSDESHLPSDAELAAAGADALATMLSDRLREQRGRRRRTPRPRPAGPVSAGGLGARVRGRLWRAVSR